MKLIREEMSSQKMYRVVEDNLQMPYETFRVDFETFQTVFIALSPWGRGATAETLASGIFKVTIRVFIIVKLSSDFLSLNFYVMRHFAKAANF